ncbi:MAG: tyrosine-type recombinase/integrase [Polyangiaceae bacterium]|nr:tyrosine-type recombinase/integrase [Polyangiaceae bacterium]
MSVRVKPWRGSGKPGWEVDIRITWPGGEAHRERRKSPLTGHDATKRWGQAREAELLRKGPPRKADPEAPTPACAPIPTLADFAPRFISEYARAERHHEAGIDSKESALRIHLIPQLGTKRLDEITTADVQKLKATFIDGVKNPDGSWKVRPTEKSKTINNRLTVLGKMLKVACDWGVIATMPCTVRLLKVSEGQLHAYEHDELDRLIEEAEKLGLEHLLVVLLGADAGLRRGEILGINQADVDHKRQQIYVQRQVYKGKEGPTKSGKPRYVPMTDRLAKALRAHRHLRGDRVLYFKEQDANRWQGEWRAVTPKVLRMWMAAVEKRAGFTPRGALHILRHTFCSRLAMKNAPVMTIKELAGHQRIETTLRYMHLSKGAKHEAIALLNAGGS